ncbi:MAG TPA: hypothetical protein VGK73_07555 [Polyangiaceae bacterium]
MLRADDMEALRSVRPAWLDAQLIAILGVGSLVMFVVGLVAVPVVLARIPADYYSRQEEREQVRRRSALGWVGWFFRNLAGLSLVLLGLLLILLPGQGILTIALGLMLLDFPGRARLERRIVGRPRVLAAINALRRRARRPPLEIAHQD